MNQIASCVSRRPGELESKVSSLRLLGNVSGSATQAAPLICNDMQFTDDFIRRTVDPWLVIIVTFADDGEPMIHGGGVAGIGGHGPADAEKNAWSFARASILAARRSPDDDLRGAVACYRTADTSPSWRSKSGRLVTIEHCRSTRSLKRAR